jgi:hypothetical protein
MVADVVNDSVLIMPMIETREGLANVEWVFSFNLLPLNNAWLTMFTKQGHCGCAGS